MMKCQPKIPIASKFILMTLCFGMALTHLFAQNNEKKEIKAIYIPLADHYALIVAYEKYRHEMKHAKLKLERFSGPHLVRPRFREGDIDLAFTVCPQAMDMFRENPNFRWVSLVHRDGNALAINDQLNQEIKLASKRIDRKPNYRVAEILEQAKKKLGHPIECAVPHLQATHMVILYKYLKDHGMTLGIGSGEGKDVKAVRVAPPKSPSFIKKKNSRGLPASFEQSLPWADVVETKGYGKVAWYSKDVLPWPNGHVECIAIASNKCINEKREALQEVIHYIHKAGRDIEQVRRIGGKPMEAIVEMIRKHIPEHNKEAIIHSLDPELMVINYLHLNLDKKGLKVIMDLAVEGGIIKEGIDIDAFADTSFATKITDQPLDIAEFGEPENLTESTHRSIKKWTKYLKKLVTEKVLIDAVKKQNSEDISLSRIKEIDKKWVAGGEKELSERLQQSSSGSFLKGLVLSNPNLSEAFLCDRQGALVAAYPRTSDYWQGDEEKFTFCFNKGQGKTHIGKVDFDKSSFSHSVQISVPVKDGKKTIGVLVLTIRNVQKQG